MRQPGIPWKAHVPWWVILLLLVLGAFELAIHSNFPSLGHDYPIWIDQLILGKWHFVRQGLAPFRYVPHLCGGAPVYGDPESLYYTLTQGLALVMSPWWALQVSLVLAMIGGYAGWYAFGRLVLHVPAHWAHALAFILLTNGFLFVQSAVGHFQMHTMPLIGVFLLLLFDPERESRRAFGLRAAAFALLAGYVLQAAGYNVLLFTALICVLMLPFDLLLSAAPLARGRRLLARLACFGGLAGLLCVSKLVAVYSFMRFYPRIVGFSPLDWHANTLAYIVKAFWLVRQSAEAFEGVPWELQEKSLFLSHLTLLGLVAGVPLAIARRHGLMTHWRRTAAVVLYGLVVFALLFQLTRGYGWLVDGFLTLPVMSSLRVSTRFLYLLSVFISIVSVYSLAGITARFDPRAGRRLAQAGLVVTLLSFAGIGVYTMHNQFRLTENYVERARSLEALAKADYLHHDVETVKEGLTDYVQAGTNCNVELLSLSEAHPDVHPGAVTEVRDGYFNLVNPACYQYPDENGCRPGDRIRVEDGANLDNFRRGLPVTWKVSRAQRAADVTSLLTLCLCVAWLTISPWSTWRAFRKPNGLHDLHGSSS
jgi:hypothetical protein